MAGRGSVAGPLLGATGLALALLYALQLSPVLNGIALVVTALGSCAALLVGPRVHGSGQRAPWHLIAIAAVAFLAGVVLRPWAAHRHGVAEGAADASTLAGYALLIAGLALMLRRRGGLERHAVTDGVIVCLGAALLSTVLFALPALAVQDRPGWISVLAGLYPLIDVVLLLLVLNLSFSTALASTSFHFIAAAMVMMFVGDLGYAWIGAQGRLTGSPLLDLPFLLTYTCFAVAALHPSMVDLSTLVGRPVQAWSASRLALIVPALASPLVVMSLPSLTGPARVTLVVTSAGLISAIMVRAVSAVRDHARVQRRLQHRATHDDLTGLANRTLLTERLNAALQAPTGPAPSLLFLDLDGFKLVNDHWGHDTGDQLLVEVASRLSRLAGPGTLVARVSGDEFAVAVGPGDDPARLAEQVRSRLAEPVRLLGLELVVTTSIGVVARTDQATAEDLLRDADMAMYRAKAEGRNRAARFDAGMRQTIRDRVEIELAMRHAIRAGQFWLAYQPIASVTDDRTLGAEALLRWTHPVRGAIAPAEFVPVAEETGLIVEIGAWVVEESLRQLADWRRQGCLPGGFQMCINVSTRQIQGPGLPEAVARELAAHDLDADQLTIEITESVMMDSPSSASEALAGLRQLGVHLSVDDFGTGYSSLSYLSRFPVTGVKIDRAFVTGLGTDERDEAIVRAVTAMASAFGLSVVAEGVETGQQRAALQRLGIDHGQGRLWGAPIAPAEFAARYLAGVQAGAGNS